MTSALHLAKSVLSSHLIWSICSIWCWSHVLWNVLFPWFWNSVPSWFVPWPPLGSSFSSLPYLSPRCHLPHDLLWPQTWGVIVGFSTFWATTSSLWVSCLSSKYILSPISSPYLYHRYPRSGFHLLSWAALTASCLVFLLCLVPYR